MRKQFLTGLAGLLVLSLSTTNVSATPLEYTGADLAGLNDVSFPTGTHRIDGDSLGLDPSTGLGVLASFDLTDFDLDFSNFGVQLDLTRLADDNGNDDNFSLHVYLSDGVNLFGGFHRAAGSDLRFDSYWARLNANRTGIQFFSNEFGISSFSPVSVGESFNLDVQVSATGDGTSIFAGLNGLIEDAGTSSRVFNPANGGVSLILAADDALENYQVNSLSFTSGVSFFAQTVAISEPESLGLFGLGLLGIAFGLHRRQRKKD